MHWCVVDSFDVPNFDFYRKKKLTEPSKSDDASKMLELLEIGDIYATFSSPGSSQFKAVIKLLDQIFSQIVWRSNQSSTLLGSYIYFLITYTAQYNKAIKALAACKSQSGGKDKFILEVLNQKIKNRLKRASHDTNLLFPQTRHLVQFQTI